MHATNYLAAAQRAAIAMLMAGAAACGGGGSTSTPTNTVTSPQGCTSATCGTAIATMTDAAGDFLSYKIGLVSLQLKKSDGTLVETLPVSTTVDLARLVTLSEIISTKQLPGGDYVSAQVTVDYSSAVILVDDGTGSGVQVAPVDSSGAALGQLQLTVSLDPKHELHIGAGKASRIGFDFNLLASNSVDLTAKTVTVSPVLIASAMPVDNKQIRVRGEIAGVDTAAASYTIQVDPFHDKGDDKHSTITVLTDDSTSFEINGTPFSGAAGLVQLATLPADAITVAFGTLQAADQSFLASRVLAGTSVAGPSIDHLSGSVVARTGNTLTIHGSDFEDHEGNDDFERHNATVTIADATQVTVEGQMAMTPAHSTAEISVGSRIDAFGTANKDGSGNLTLDASAGRVRLDFTRVQGLLSASAAGQVTLNLNSIDRQSIALFNFAGTGSTSAADSDPAHYVLNTGNLDTSVFATGNALLGIGFVNAFGAAPPDFNAVTLANGNGHDEMNDEDNAQLEIEWGDAGTAAPFKLLDASHLDLDIANPAISQKHDIKIQSREIDLKSLGSDPSIVPDSGSMTLFAIQHKHGNGTENFNTFADFETQLAGELDGTQKAFRLNADGHYDATANTFTARRITVRLDN